MEKEDALGHVVIASVGGGRGSGSRVGGTGRASRVGSGREMVVRCASLVQLQVLCSREEGAEGRCEGCFAGGRDGRARRIGLAWAGQYEEVCHGGGNGCVLSGMLAGGLKDEADAALRDVCV